MNDTYPSSSAPLPDPEQYLPHPNFEPLVGAKEVQLNSLTGHQFDVPDINGHVLAVLELPTPTSMVDDKTLKQVALVDFGEQCEQPGESVYVCTRPDVGEKVWRMIGRTTPGKRYGLTALNYRPQNHMSTYTPIAEGEPAILGTDNRPENRTLGLLESDPRDRTDERHVGVAFTGKGSIVFKDFATEHGTRIALATPEVADVASVAETTDTTAPGVAEVPGAEDQPTPTGAFIKTAGGVAMEGVADWDVPNKVELRETGEYSSKEVELLRELYHSLHMARSEAEVTTGLGSKLIVVEKEAQKVQISKRSAMLAGVLGAVGLPEGSSRSGEAERLLNNGVLPPEQQEALNSVIATMRRERAAGKTEAELIDRIDGALDGKFDRKGRVVQEGIFSKDGVPRAGLENYAAALLAVTVGLDKSGMSGRTLRLSNYMKNGQRGRSITRLEER